MDVSELAQRIKRIPPGGVRIELPEMAKQAWPYQKNDIAWCLAAKQGVVGHEVGTGKTIIALGAIQYLATRGLLRGAVVLCPKMGGVLTEQWISEAAAFTPNLMTSLPETREERKRAYRDPSWDLLVVNYESARNDIKDLKEMQARGRANFLWCDESSKFRNPTKTAALIRAISGTFEYRFAVTGTPIEMDVLDLHTIMYSMGWEDVIGSRGEFMRRYTIREPVTFYVRGRRRMKAETVGYQNLGELRERLAPHMIRRTLEDPAVAAEIPAVQSLVHQVPMTSRQRSVYRATKEGVVTEVTEQGVRLSYADTVGLFMRLMGAADGTQTVNPDLADESGKSDWLMAALDTQFRGEKVLVFSRFVRSIRVLEERMRRAGIGYGLYIGSSHQSQKDRRRDVKRFREDEECQVLMCTTAATFGVNLQVARAAVFYGIVPNPKTLEQVMGRIKRPGSRYATIQSITLLSQDTVEEKLWDKVIRRNALADYVWEEESAMFERLGREQLQEMIRG